MSPTKVIKETLSVDKNQVYNIKLFVKNEKISEGWRSKVVFDKDISFAKSDVDLLLDEIDTFTENWGKIAKGESISGTYNIILTSEFNTYIRNMFANLLNDYLGVMKLPGTDLLFSRKDFEGRKYPISVEFENHNWNPKIQIRIMHQFSDNLVGFYTNVENGYSFLNIKFNENLLKLFYIIEYSNNNQIYDYRKIIEKGFSYLNNLFLLLDLKNPDFQLNIAENPNYSLSSFLKFMGREYDQKDKIIEEDDLERFIKIFKKSIFFLLDYLISGLKNWLDDELKKYIVESSKVTSYDSLLLELKTLFTIISENKEFLVRNEAEIEVLLKDLNKYQDSFDFFIPNIWDYAKFKDLEKIVHTINMGTLHIPDLNTFFSLIMNFFNIIETRYTEENIDEVTLEYLIDLLKKLEKLSQTSQEFNNYFNEFFQELDKFMKDYVIFKGNADLSKIVPSGNLSIKLLSDYQNYIRSEVNNINYEEKQFQNLTWIKGVADNNIRINKIIHKLDNFKELNSYFGQFLIFKYFNFYFNEMFTVDPENIYKYFKLTKLLFILKELQDDFKKKYSMGFTDLLNESVGYLDKFREDLKFLNIDCKKSLNKSGETK